MTRRGLLRGAGVLGLLGWLGAPRRARAGAPTRLLVLWNGGGWDPTFVFDPHFDDGLAPEDAAPETAGGISFAAAETRPSVSRFFQRYGAQSCVVNGLGVGSISHDGCTRLMLTGSRRDDQPDLPTRVAWATGASLALPHVVLSGPRYPGELGAAVVPLSARLTGTLDGSLPAGGTSWSTESEAAMRAYLRAEGEAMGQGSRVGDWLDGLDRLETLEGALDALSVPEDPTDEQTLSLAVDVLASGLARCVMVDAGLPNQTTWDSHFSNAAHQDRAFENLFDRLVTLCDALAGAAGDQGSLLDETLVLVLSEMGRAPSLNAAEGKDHWPHTSALLVGAGVSGGRVVGASDASLVGEVVDLGTGEASATGERVGPLQLAAGLLEAFDIDPAEHLPGTTPLRAPYG